MMRIFQKNYCTFTTNRYIYWHGESKALQQNCSAPAGEGHVSQGLGGPDRRQLPMKPLSLEVLEQRKKQPGQGGKDVKSE
jgi:hypothetical protein